MDVFQSASFRIWVTKADIFKLNFTLKLLDFQGIVSVLDCNGRIQHSFHPLQGAHAFSDAVCGRRKSLGWFRDGIKCVQKSDKGWSGNLSGKHLFGPEPQQHGSHCNP